MIKPIRFTTDGLDKRGPAVALAYDGMPTPAGHTRTDAKTGAYGTARRIREMLPDAFAPFTEAVQEYRDAQAEVKRLEAIIAEARTPTELHIAEREGKIESAKAKIAELTEAKEQLSEAEADVHMALSFFHHMCQHDHEAMKALNAAVADAHAKRYAAAHAKAEKIRSMASELVERLSELPDRDRGGRSADAATGGCRFVHYATRNGVTATPEQPRQSVQALRCEGGRNRMTCQRMEALGASHGMLRGRRHGNGGR